MGAIFKQEGEALDFVPAADVVAGDVVVQGELVGVAKLDIKTGVLGALSVDGVFDFPKAMGAGTAIAAGAKVYWDTAEQVAKEDAEAGANKLIGKVAWPATDADAVVSANLGRGSPDEARNVVWQNHADLAHLGSPFSR
jgi:predicted RecA/RadA family phage recombinase